MATAAGTEPWLGTEPRLGTEPWLGTEPFFANPALVREAINLFDLVVLTDEIRRVSVSAELPLDWQVRQSRQFE